MRLLILGGTMFLGREVVDLAVGKGWDVVTFNRGLSSPDRPGVVAVRGDRSIADDVARVLDAGPFDAVVDCSGYVPRNVLDMARSLRPCVGRYVFVSSVSAYAGWPSEPLSESSPELPCPADAGPDFGVDVEDGPTRYGYQKSGCELAVRETFGEDGVSLRLGVMLGPREYVGRLPWWLRRLARGGDVLAPGTPDRTIQPLDVRDAAVFTLSCVEGGLSGTFNLTAPIGHATFGELLTSCASVTGSSSALYWVSDQDLITAGVRQWSEIPLWRSMPGVWAVDSSRAVAAGLAARPVVNTVRDTWAWMRTGDEVDGQGRSAEIGLAPEREAVLLRQLRPHVRAG